MLKIDVMFWFNFHATFCIAIINTGVTTASTTIVDASAVIIDAIDQMRIYCLEQRTIIRYGIF